MTQQLTALYQLPYYQGSDLADGATQQQALAARLDTVLQAMEALAKPVVGLRSDRPASGNVGQRYFASDSMVEFLDTGSAWMRMGLAAGTTACILAAAAPTGWLLASGGAIVNSGPTVDLYAAIGATLPDLRGRVPVGVDSTAGSAGRIDSTKYANADTLGGVGGIDRHGLVEAELGAHAHTQQGSFNSGTESADHTHAFNQTVIATGPVSQTAGQPNFLKEWSPQFSSVGTGGRSAPHYHTVTISGSTQNAGSGTAHQNMPPYQVLNWIVKL